MMSVGLSLHRRARRRLEKRDRRRRDADTRVRIRAILEVAAGLSCNGAAREVGEQCGKAIAVPGRST